MYDGWRIKRIISNITMWNQLKSVALPYEISWNLLHYPMKSVEICCITLWNLLKSVALPCEISRNLLHYHVKINWNLLYHLVKSVEICCITLQNQGTVTRLVHPHKFTFECVGLSFCLSLWPLGKRICYERWSEIISCCVGIPGIRDGVASSVGITNAWSVKSWNLKGKKTLCTVFFSYVSHIRIVC